MEMSPMPADEAAWTESDHNFDRLCKMDLRPYVGLWITVVDAEVAFSGPDEEEVLAQTRQRYPDRVPMLFKVPGYQSLTL